MLLVADLGNSATILGLRASDGEIDRIIARSRELEKEKDLRDLLPAGPA